MFRSLVVAGLATMAAGVLVSAEAQKGPKDDLVFLGSSEVSLSQGEQSIDVSKAKGNFKAIRVRVKNGGIDLSRVKIVYLDGRVHDENRSMTLKRGERTKEIDPRADGRFIDKVEISYNPVSGTKRTVVVEVWGVQSRDGARAIRPTTGDIAADATGPDRTTGAGAVTSGGDLLFGAQNVGFGVDRDVIRVGSQIGKFSRIRLRVLENDIFVKEFRVVYADGDADTLAVNAEVKRNSRTQWLDIKKNKFLSEIQLAYRSKPNFKGQARVEVFGEYAEGWLGPSGEGRKYNQGWVLLGSQTAGFIGFDKDIIPVGRNEGGFKKIRVTVKDRAITLNELRVVYAKGGEDIIPVRTRVDAGDTYGPIDLKGGNRAIKEIEARYRSRFFDKSAKGKGMGLVEVWGQH